MSDWISRMDAVQACQVGPSDEWSQSTKSGYNQAATDCAMNILRIAPALAAERDAAYANGYSDAETEINQSVLGLENTFLHSQYADAKLRIEDLQAQTMRLSGMVHDLKKEVAISDALLISEAEVSLERLARAEAAEAERDSYLKALENIIKDYEPGYPLSHDVIKYVARAALNGESHD